MPHPVRPRPSPRPTGRAAEPACQTSLWPICLQAVTSGLTKEMEILQPDSIYHNLSPRRPLDRGRHTCLISNAFIECNVSYFSCQSLNAFVVLRFVKRLRDLLRSHFSAASWLDSQHRICPQVEDLSPVQAVYIQHGRKWVSSFTDKSLEAFESMLLF